MKYMIDTNTVAAREKQPTGRLLAKIVAVGLENIVTSVIVAGELRFVIARARTAELKANLSTLFGTIMVLPLDEPVALRYGSVRAELAHKGKPIGANGLWIAAHALALDLTLVTGNVGEFERVPALRVENWLQ